MYVIILKLIVFEIIRKNISFFVEWSRLFCNQLKIYEKTRLEKIKTEDKNIASFSLSGCCNVNF